MPGKGSDGEISPLRLDTSQDFADFRVLGNGIGDDRLWEFHTGRLVKVHREEIITEVLLVVAANVRT